MAEFVHRSICACSELYIVLCYAMTNKIYNCLIHPFSRILSPRMEFQLYFTLYTINHQKHVTGCIRYLVVVVVATAGLHTGQASVWVPYVSHVHHNFKSNKD